MIPHPSAAPTPSSPAPRPLAQLTDQDIASLPIPQLQSRGFLFVWVINAKYKWTLDAFEKWGYR